MGESSLFSSVFYYFWKTSILISVGGACFIYEITDFFNFSVISDVFNTFLAETATETAKSFFFSTTAPALLAIGNKEFKELV